MMEDLGLEKVLEAEGFILARKGQKLTVCWGIMTRKMIVMRDIEQGSGTWITNAAELEPFLIPRDGEFRERVKLYMARIGGATEEYRNTSFPKFLNKCIKHLDKEE